LRGERRLGIVRQQFGGSIPARGNIYRSHSQGCEPRRSAGSIADQIRVDRKSQDCGDARIDHFGIVSAARRRGARIKTDFAALRSVAIIGTRRTCEPSAIRPLSGVKRTWLRDDATSAHDPKRISYLFSRYPPRCIYMGRDLTPNDVDVTAQIVQLVREG